MSKTEIAAAKIRQIADEIAWRDFWYARVMIETGQRGPAKLPIQEHSSEADR